MNTHLLTTTPTSVLRLRLRVAERTGATLVTTKDGGTVGTLAQVATELAARDGDTADFRTTWTSGTGATQA